VAGTTDVDHVEVVFLDCPVEVHVDEVQPWRRAPVAEQPGLDVLGREGLAKQGIVQEIDLADGEIVCRPPVRIDGAELVS
jgi:hypothetical protein